MRRALAPLIAGSMLAACGLTITGLDLAPDASSTEEAGASETGTSTSPDGASSDGSTTPSDAGADVVLVEPEAGVDAGPPHDCHVSACPDAGTACFYESCMDPGHGAWQMGEATGGKLMRTAGVCHATATAMPGSVGDMTITPFGLGPRFSYDVWLDVRTGLDVSANLLTLFFSKTPPNGNGFITSNGTVLLLCADALGGGQPCVPMSSVPNATTSAYLHVYGATDGSGTATLIVEEATSANTCVEIGRTTVPHATDQVGISIGCIGGGACDRTFGPAIAAVSSR